MENLTQDARIRYASDSIEDILGYLPHEVVNKSCWEYFHPDEIPFARTIHGRGVKLDKAAVLNYCQIRHKNGFWVGCECVFTVVYDVLVASTSIYRRDSRSEKRAADAPVVRSLFTSSPRDPRYHMLTYISSKFSQLPRTLSHEPRAALFLNRFTRTSTIMFATNGVTEILGVTPQQLVSKSFYYCIQERCLRDAVCCLESAKANDSIAYLRFWYRNPLQEDTVTDDDDDDDTDMADACEEEEDESSRLGPNITPQALTNTETRPEVGSGRGSGNEVHPESEIEVEAVVSCTSDGLVVVLRRARPPIPHNIQQTKGSPVYANGLFASPWATDPVFSHPDCAHPSSTSRPSQPTTTNQGRSSRNFPGARMAGPDANNTATSSITTAPKNTPGGGGGGGGGSHSQLLDTIRDVAVFAWGVVGINGSLERYKRGTPMGESQPPGGLQRLPPADSSNSNNNNNNNNNSSNNNRMNTSSDSSSCGVYHRSLCCREPGSCRNLPSVQPQERSEEREYPS